jgi:hypothetical protein
MNVGIAVRRSGLPALGVDWRVPLGTTAEPIVGGFLMPTNKYTAKPK